METNETKQVVQRLTNLNDNGGKKPDKNFCTRMLQRRQNLRSTKHQFCQT